MSLGWKFRRLKAMGAGEIVYRVWQTGKAYAESVGIGLARPGVPVGEVGRPWVDRFPRNVAPRDYCRAADSILAGRFDVFALKSVEMGFPPEWNRDPKTGVVAPLTFGKRLQYRDDRIVGNIKYLWEPSRHLELVTLAQAWYLTGDEKYASGCRTYLESWFEQAPYPCGPHWTSSLEHAVRLVNWAVAWQLLCDSERSARIFDGASGEKFRLLWLRSIYQHCHFISGYLSRYSSANNHLLGEYMGLFVASVVWPMWPESAKWSHVARRGFEREVIRQTCSDGVGREQAVWYQHEVLDMMLICGLLGRANRIEFSSGFWQRMEAMMEFLASIMDVAGNVPAIGDSDDAVMVRFSRERQFCVFRSLLATGAVLFGRGDFKCKAGAVMDDKTRWLLGDQADQRFAALHAVGSPPARRAFAEGGYFVIGADFGTEREVRIVADAGPLGYLAIAAHGHADALSFTLSAAGRALLVDPGTYSYHSEKKWRDYFRGTAAHNTVLVDGQDQSVSGGNFLWIRHARTRCEGYEEGLGEGGAFLAASHDGYARLGGGVRHRREWRYEQSLRRLRVGDAIEGHGQHAIALHWHFHPACNVVLREDHAIAQREGVVLRLFWPPGLDARVARAEVEPAMGWFSSRFDEKEPAPTLVVTGVVGAGWQGESRMEIEFM